MRVVMIESAINGNQMRDRNPHVPWSTSEIVADAIAVCRAGASLVHFHVRDPHDGAWVHDVPSYAAAIRGIRAGCDALLWPTLANGTDPVLRYQHMFGLAADPATRPDLGLCDPGSVNLAGYDPITRQLRGERTYLNSAENSRYFLQACKELGLRPSVQVFDASFLRAALVFLEQGLLAEPLMLKFYLGGPAVPVGLPPTRASLLACLQMLAGVRCHWFAGALGADIAPLIPDIVELGGHVRVGFEDCLHADGPSPPLTNPQIVERAADAIRALGHQVATPADARRLIEP
ncbi:3-keto-5-aminohexanoate cleavage protein [Hydrogenophaga sp.]|uniref:3-keto-5-aminohexanoate cleavage protein n=1 Tax=Hydrogenophaga sp. TaxID=1904254 RepID=UPI0026347E24|nr:3-keto-5-aminohexanoate cleavage protein [Hydrogenophaga sp.]MCW5654346.1 3-keto-5-aminohexanoate cleavage protein [Hydrogenophaga sp.]